MEKKVGAVVYATEQGLGYLAKDFFDNGIIDKVLIHEHTLRPAHREWYPRESVVSSYEELLEQCDTILFFETPFVWKYIPKAREAGKKTVLMPMYECTLNPNPYVPDLILTPSDLDQQFYPQGIRVNVPVSVQWHQRSKAEVFVHNAGNGGLGGRNGTAELLAAMKWVKSPIKLILRTQTKFLAFNNISDPRIDLRVGTFEDIWSEGDVFIFPEKFNGLSLPLQEAFASGMAVMASDRFPNNQWLPREPLIPVEKYRKEKLAVRFDIAELSPATIAKHIDEWFNRDITDLSLRGKEWGAQNSWQKLKERYKELL
jgi:hypothetical protein